MIEALNNWLECVRHEDIDKFHLVLATQSLVDELNTISVAYRTPEGSTLHPQFSEAFNINRNLIGLSAQFLWGLYTDSDTDAPCDIEWDVHHLMKAILPSYEIPADVGPAYVMGTVYPTPDGDEDEPEHHAH